MTIEFLRQSPLLKQSSQKLSVMLANTDGRLYILTGNISTAKSIQNELAEVVKWAANSPLRELVILVGVFSNIEGNFDEKLVAASLAKLIGEAALDAKKQLGGSQISLNARFFAAEKWHAKAIGLTGTGGRFLDAKSAIFGSTNFTHSARHGESFELDTFIQGDTDEHAVLLKSYTNAVGLLIQEAIVHKRFPGFESLVIQNIQSKNSYATFNKVVGSPENFWSLDM